jgi:hypothetical protein
MKLGRYRKGAAAVVAGLAVMVAAIPTDAPLWVVGLGQLVTTLAVICGPANDPKTAKTVGRLR